jgi:mono/diheme cytochrome c family protein
MSRWRPWLMLCGLGLAASVQAQTRPGEALFARHCAACHQTTGLGTPGLAPSLKGSHWDRLGREPRYLASVVLNGLSGPIQVDGQRFVGAMPGFAASLSDAELVAVLEHVAHLQERPPTTVDPAVLASLRAAAGHPGASRVLREQLLR